MSATSDKPTKRPAAMAAAVALLACALAILLAPAGASAAPPTLWDRCDRDEPAGQQCAFPRGVAADPDNGHVFVADQFNSRVVEFTALGEFVRTWGWDVVAGGGTGFEICVPEEGDECKAGVGGSGAGQLSNPMGLAVDSGGNVYVVDFSNSRVQKFDPDGNFLLSFGTPGAGAGQFSWSVGGDFIAIDVADNVYVGGEERIQRFDTAGVHQDECTVPGSVQSLATDSSGNLYAAYSNQLDVRKLTFLAGGECGELQRFEIPEPDEFTHPGPSAVAVDVAGHVYTFSDKASGNGFVPLDRIFEFDAAGNVVDEFGKEEFAGSTGLATNLCAGSEAPGNLYVTNAAFGTGPPHSAEAFVRAYGTPPIGCFKARTLPATDVTETGATLNGTVNPKGEPVSECFFEYGTTTAYDQEAACEDPDAGEIGSGSTPVPVHADISGLQAGTVYHFRLSARVGGELESGADVEFKTFGPPLISDQHVFSATDDEATVKALVNPEGFPTSCHVEYGLDTSYGQSTEEASVGSDRAEHPVLTILDGLEPGTTYHWRYLCSNTAAANGGLTEGEDHTFATYRPFLADTNCPNQAFRTSYSAQLPDCRAYEMVSPVDKNGANIIRGNSSLGDPGGFVQVAPEGDRITYYGEYAAFGEDLPSSFRFNQYLAARQDGQGWVSQGINPPLNGLGFFGTQLPLCIKCFRFFSAFSHDLCSAWFIDAQFPPLTPEAPSNAAGVYRRDNCGSDAGTFESVIDLAMIPLEEPELGRYIGQDAIQGFSEDSRHAIFEASAPLTDDAAAGTNEQLYDRFDGNLSLVSVLPGGVPNPTNATVGGVDLQGAVSSDGSHVYWTPGGSTGKIYLRLHPEQGIVAKECTKASRACTIEVSVGSKASFRAASADGSKALYSEGEKLYEFNLAAEESHLLADDVLGVAGASEDLSHIYLVSRTALPDSGSNSEGDEALAGDPNLYLAEGGSFEFIGTLVAGDLGEREPDGYAGAGAYDLVGTPGFRATRVTPDGLHFAFQSRAPLTGYDNVSVSGKPAVEVFRFQAGGELLCVSCNPSGARPQSRELTFPLLKQNSPASTLVQAAAWIPTWEHPLYASHVLSDDGRRLFFNSNDALLPRDTNGAQDVYEWEAVGSGGCNGEDSGYLPQNGGCLYLISSGESSYESEIWEASPDGRDVFFTTASSLLPQDPGSLDLYDARAGGGFPQPIVPAACEGEACQSPPAPPDDPTPASSVFEGAGNVKQPPPGCRPAARRAKRAANRAARLRRAARRAPSRARRGKAKRAAKRARKLSRQARRCRRQSRRPGR